MQSRRGCKKQSTGCPLTSAQSNRMLLLWKGPCFYWCLQDRERTFAPFVFDFLHHCKRQEVLSACLVIVPLVALVKDQVASALLAQGMSAVSVGADCSSEEVKVPLTPRAVCTRVRHHKIKGKFPSCRVKIF